jgi:archaellum component FlaC
MVGDGNKTQLQDMRVEIDGLVTNIKTIRKWVDSTVTTAKAQFD